MAKLPSEVLAHLEWLGFVQPTGLVVSAPAMVRAGAILNRNDQEGQRLLRAAVVGTEEDAGEDAAPRLADFSTFSKDVLGWRWSPKGYAGTKDAPIPDELHVHLPAAKSPGEKTVQPLATGKVDCAHRGALQPAVGQRAWYTRNCVSGRHCRTLWPLAQAASAVGLAYPSRAR